MIREDRDPAFWERVANDPAVRPSLGGAERLTFGPAMESEAVLPLATEGGGFLFVQIAESRWELHTMFLPGHRGRHVLAAFRQAARWLFTRTNCEEIVTKVAGSNPAAALMATRAGFRRLFVRRGGWEDGSDLTHFVLTVDEWANGDPEAMSQGHAFHDLLEDAKREAGSPLPVHPDDDAHDAAAGAAVLMARGGQPAKAVWFYNRWAAFAGYAPIQLTSEDPPVIDIRDALIAVRDGNLEVLECLGAQQQR